MTVDTQSEQRADTISGLRAFADFLEANPKVGMPFGSVLTLNSVDDAAGMAAEAKGMGGRWEKFEGVEGLFQLRRDFGPCASHRISTKRANVCERIVKGTCEVTVTEPDQAAVDALPKVTRTETVEDVEWVCPESLLAVVAA